MPMRPGGMTNHLNGANTLDAVVCLVVRNHLSCGDFVPMLGLQHSSMLSIAQCVGGPTVRRSVAQDNSFSRHRQHNSLNK